jgi:hypothetical protein
MWFFLKHLFFPNTYTQWQCCISFDNSFVIMYLKAQKYVRPCGIRTWDLLFWRRTRWPPCQSTRSWFGILIFSGFLNTNVSPERKARMANYGLMDQVKMNNFAQPYESRMRGQCYVFFNRLNIWRKCWRFWLDILLFRQKNDHNIVFFFRKTPFFRRKLANSQKIMSITLT